MLLRMLPALPFERLKRCRGRLLLALSCYLVLALTAVFALDGFLRAAVLFFIAILAVKTLRHAGDAEMD